MKIRQWADCRSDEDRMRYHTQVYAWRILRGHAEPHHRTSPNDPRGEWYAADAVAAEFEIMRASVGKSSFRFSDDEIRARLEWARNHGYETWGDFLDEVQAGRQSIVSFVEWCGNRFAMMPRPKVVEGFKSVGDALRDLGVTATPAPRSPFASYPDKPS